MRLKARSKIQKYTPDSELNENENNETFVDANFREDECHQNHANSSKKQREEFDLLIFEIFVENLQMDLKRLLSSNAYLKENMPDFESRKELVVNFIKTGKVNSEANDTVRRRNNKQPTCLFFFSSFKVIFSC